jgi:hypothetical protein
LDEVRKADVREEVDLLPSEAKVLLYGYGVGMETPLTASSATAGALISAGRFHVPQFQREYAWGSEEVQEFFDDLAGALNGDTYFLGLVIVTGGGQTKAVVDGQQRLLTLTLLAAALYHEARKYERRALAERLQSTFLLSIDFESDDELPRLVLSSAADNATLQQILNHPASELTHLSVDDESVSGHLISAYRLLTDRLIDNLSTDPFKRLGTWAEFLTSKLYLASFVHPNPASAYRVFEIINTRGKELTTADLLKSYVLSQTPEDQREQRYRDWQRIASAFSDESPSVFVQFIRHAVTTQRGHVLPSELYDVLASRGNGSRRGMTPAELVGLLEESLPAYLQMMDPTAEGPATQKELAVFSVLNRINVVAVRPILLSMMGTPNAAEGMEALLRLVVRRVVVGALGTGNVERRLSQVAQRIAEQNDWEAGLDSLRDLDRTEEEFRDQVHHRSLSRNVLTVIRQSVLQQTPTPDPIGYLYFIKPRNSEWTPADQDRATYWAATIGNTFLATISRRPAGSSDWTMFKETLLLEAVDGEWTDELSQRPVWDVSAISEVGEKVAAAATSVWYG